MALTERINDDVPAVSRTRRKPKTNLQMKAQTKTEKRSASRTAERVGSDAMVRRFWCVMKAHGWDGLTVAGIPMQAPKEGPQRFIPVFDTREQAVAWAGTDEHVYALESVA